MPPIARFTRFASLTLVLAGLAGPAGAQRLETRYLAPSPDTAVRFDPSSTFAVLPAEPDYDDWFDDLYDAHDTPASDPSGLVAPPSPLVSRLSYRTGGVRAPYGPVDQFAWGGPAFDIAVFEDSIRAALTGKVVGYAYAINYRKSLYSASYAGIARNATDGLAYQSAYKTMNIASVSKLLTTIGVLQLLEMNGMSINDPIWPWLPDDWMLGPGVTNVTFKHLLTHQTGWSGISNLSWSGLQSMIASGASPSNENLNDGNADPGYAYENANFGLFRILVPALWDASPEDPGIDYIEDWSSSVWYAVYMQDHVFEPIGIDHAMCTNVEGDVFYYDVDDPDEAGVDGGNWIDFCMFGGWYLSAYDLAKILAYLRYTEVLLSQESRELMDDKLLGWNAPDKWSDWAKGEHGTYLAHGGDIYFDDDDAPLSREVHACVMQFPIQVEVALLINSSRNFSSYQCTLLKKAFEDAWIE